jgi:hypothetical protein
MASRKPTKDEPTGFIGDTQADPEDAREPKTVDKAAEPADLRNTDDRYEKGYLGALPDEDNRPDLTLQGVLKDQGEQK